MQCQDFYDILLAIENLICLNRSIEKKLLDLELQTWRNHFHERLQLLLIIQVLVGASNERSHLLLQR